MYPLRRNQDPAPRLHYCFLTVPPLSLYPLPFLINNRLNLLIGTQVMEVEWSIFPVIKKWRTHKGFCAQEPTGSCLVSVAGWCSQTLNLQPSDSNQSGVHLLMLSLKLPSSTWVGTLVSAEELRGIVMYIPSGGTRTLLQGCTVVSWLFLPCFFIPFFPWLATVWIGPLELREI